MAQRVAALATHLTCNDFSCPTGSYTKMGLRRDPVVSTLGRRATWSPCSTARITVLVHQLCRSWPLQTKGWNEMADYIMGRGHTSGPSAGVSRNIGHGSGVEV
eukprot:4344329-Amphidinium_carterae.1